MIQKRVVIFCPIGQDLQPFASMADWLRQHHSSNYAAFQNHVETIESSGKEIPKEGQWFSFGSVFYSQCLEITDTVVYEKFSASVDHFWFNRHLDLARAQCELSGADLKFVKFDKLEGDSAVDPYLPQTTDLYNGLLSAALHDYKEYRHKNKDTGYCLATDAVIAAPYPH